MKQVTLYDNATLCLYSVSVFGLYCNCSRSTAFFEKKLFFYCATAVFLNILRNVISLCHLKKRNRFEKTTVVQQKNYFFQTAIAVAESPNTARCTQPQSTSELRNGVCAGSLRSKFNES